MITISLHRADLACVITTPSLFRRFFLRASETERFATRVPLITGGFGWRFDDGSPVSAEVLRAIEREVRVQRRPRARAVEPPS